MLTRRHFLSTGAGLAVAGALGLPSLILRPAEARILVVGGGPGGVAAALAIKARNPAAELLVVERDPRQLLRESLAGIISGRREPTDYHHLAAVGIAVSLDEIRAIDWQDRRADGLSGRSFGFDDIVIAPGIAMRDERIAGYDREAAELFPHGWTDRAGVEALAADIRAMNNGGTVIIRIPPGRMRFPEGPYRRADEIARYFASEKPDSLVVLLDHGAPHPKKQALLARLARAHGDRIEYVSGETFGPMRSVDTANRVLNGEYESLCGDVISFIPAQEAGRIARVSGLADDSGWCPTDTATGRSLKQARAFLIGDSANEIAKADMTGIARSADKIATAIA